MHYAILKAFFQKAYLVKIYVLRLYSNFLNLEKMDLIKAFYFQEGGFFVECGAFNGEIESNSLFFERERAWKGLLIEADPNQYTALKGKNRKAFTSNTCLSTVPYPVRVSFIFKTFIQIRVTYFLHV